MSIRITGNVPLEISGMFDLNWTIDSSRRKLLRNGRIQDFSGHRDEDGI
jgi:hypothetical protein